MRARSADAADVTGGWTGPQNTRNAPAARTCGEAADAAHVATPTVASAMQVAPAMLSLQRTVGNRAVGAMLRRGGPRSPVVQRRGAPPYPREVTLQSPYVSLRIRHPDRATSVAATDAERFEVLSLTARSRPPVWMGGVQSIGSQGQHKVAWVAIWSALARCEGQSLTDAIATVRDIAARSRVPLRHAPVPQQNVMNHPSPAGADDLLALAHTYLVSRQRDDPSWAAEGSEEERRGQLAGKGERALQHTLRQWRAADPDDTSGEDVTDFLTSSAMPLLFDVTGRGAGEAADAAARATRELEVHNPRLFEAHADRIRAWIESRTAPATAMDID